MSDGPLFHRSQVQNAFAALRKDLVHEDGPRISTMRNYRFAIVQYAPEDEYRARQETQQLSEELIQHGWELLSISLATLLIERLRGMGEAWVDKVIAMERATSKASVERGLNYLSSKLAPMIEGPEGVAADCARLIREHVAKHPDKAERTLAIIGRAGALYPFFRTSALLKHLDGQTNNVPVVLLYPGSRHGENGLSFMGVLNPDRDYRPRIYS